MMFILKKVPPTPKDNSGNYRRKSKDEKFCATLTSVTEITPFYFKNEFIDKSPPQKKQKIVEFPPPPRKIESRIR